MYTSIVAAINNDIRAGGACRFCVGVGGIRWRDLRARPYRQNKNALRPPASRSIRTETVDGGNRCYRRQMALSGRRSIDHRRTRPVTDGFRGVRPARPFAPSAHSTSDARPDRPSRRQPSADRPRP